MAAIDFKQVAAPNFADANSLLKLASEQREAAFKGVQGTFDDAMTGIQGNVHGQLQNLINSQTKEQLADPAAQQALQTQMAAITEPTGNNYDPLLINSYRDGRATTLNAREQGVNENTLSSLNAQGKAQSNEWDVINNQHSALKLGREAKQWGIDDAAVAKESNYKEALGGYELWRTAASAHEVGSPEYTERMDKARQYVTDSNLSAAEKVRLIDDINAKAYSSTEKQNKLTIQGQTITGNDITNQQKADNLGYNADKNNRSNLASDMSVIAQSDKTATAKQAALDAASANYGGGAGDYYVNADGQAVANWDKIKTRINGQSEMIRHQVENPEGIEDFSTYVRGTKDKNGNIPDVKLINKMSQVFTQFNNEASKAGKPIITEGQKLKIYSDYMSGEMKNHSWWNFSNEGNFIAKTLPNALSKVLLEENAKVGAKKKEYYLQQFDGLNSGQQGGSFDYSASMLGLTTQHPDFEYLPSSVKKSIRDRETAAKGTQRTQTGGSGSW